ncbi:MAG: peptidase, partial [Polaromonas sp.]|nr:peptidase [Polaromonas sp.]
MPIEAAPAMAQPTPETVRSDTLAWLERAVIGLNLCPFAKSVYVKGQIHVAVSAAREAQAVEEDLRSELLALAAQEPDLRDTTLLVLPHALGDFLDFNDFLDRADAALEALELDGVFQIASFHPDYQFAGTPADDVSNCTNRSPYPIL